MKSLSFKLGMILALLFVLATLSPLWAKKQSGPSSPEPMTLRPGLALMADQLTAKAPKFKRVKVAVMDFQELNGTAMPLCSYWADNLTSELARTGKVDVLERRLVHKIVAEQKFQQSDLAKPELITKAGKLLGADWVVTGVITDLGQQVEFNGRALDVKSGRVVAQSVVRIFKQEVASMMVPGASPPPTPPPTQPTPQPPPQEVLSVNFSFIATVNTPQGPQFVNIQPGMALHSKDKIKIMFQANRDCYVYVIQFGSSGLASILFPNVKIALSNPVKGMNLYYLPPGEQWYYLDETTGREKLLLIASLNPLPNLDKLVGDLQAAKGDPAVISKAITAEVNRIYRGRGIDEAGRPIGGGGTGTEGKQDKSKDNQSERSVKSEKQKDAKVESAGRPIESSGTEGVRDIGGITEGPALPLLPNNANSPQIGSYVLQDPTLVARELTFEHLP